MGIFDNTKEPSQDKIEIEATILEIGWRMASTGAEYLNVKFKSKNPSFVFFHRFFFFHTKPDAARISAIQMKEILRWGGYTDALINEIGSLERQKLKDTIFDMTSMMLDAGDTIKVAVKKDDCGRYFIPSYFISKGSVQHITTLEQKKEIVAQLAKTAQESCPKAVNDVMKGFDDLERVSMTVDDIPF